VKGQNPAEGLMPSTRRTKGWAQGGEHAQQEGREKKGCLAKSPVPKRGSVFTEARLNAVTVAGKKKVKKRWGADIGRGGKNKKMKRQEGGVLQSQGLKLTGKKKKHVLFEKKQWHTGTQGNSKKRRRAPRAGDLTKEC